MQIVHVANFDDFHKTFDARTAFQGWTYRGHGDASWPLIPKAGREQHFLDVEEEMFRAWKRLGFEYVENAHGLTDWDWLAIAQHHGLATRLLDWTRNPLAAAFFAVEHNHATDAAVFAYSTATKIEQHSTEDPLLFQGIARVQPRPVAARIGRQSGSFTVHGPPDTDLADALNQDDELIKLVIAKSFREKLLVKLGSLGVHRATLFPDLDGLAAYMNWVTEEWSRRADWL